MDYHIDFGIWGGIFAVPTALADQHLKLCGESQLKVLLLALRDAPNPVDVQYIGKRLGLTPTAVCDALDYWQQAGVFNQSEAPVPENSPVATEAPRRGAAPKTVTEVENGVGEQQITTIHSRGRLTPSQINQLSLTDASIPWLLEELQNRLARPLSPAESETVIYLYTYLHLTPDYLLMAVEYCKCVGKSNMRYIEKLVTGWVDQGVDTHDKAEQHIRDLTRRASDEGLIRTLFGISDRELSSKEKGYINQWFREYGFDTEVIKLAYERTVDNTGKVAFPYLHKILAQWHSQGIHTAADAQREIQSRQGTKRDAENPSFDVGDIERMMQRNTQG